MICHTLNSLPIWTGVDITCVSSNAQSIGSHAALAATGLTLIWLLIRLVKSRTKQPHPWWDFSRITTAAVLMVFTGFALALASAQPALVPQVEAPGGHIVVVLDVSDSVTRGENTYNENLVRLADRLDALTRLLQEKKRARMWTGSVVVFAGNVSVAVTERPIEQLATTLRVLPRPDGGGDDSNGAASLRLAREQILGMGGAGLILLVTDGNWLSGDTNAEISALRRSNIPVYIFPSGSDAPGQGVVAANLSASTGVGASSIARLVVLPDNEGDELEVAVRRDDQRDRAHAATVPSGVGPTPIRIETTFQARGIRHLEIILLRAGKVQQTRHLFTLVKAPPRLLVFGAAAWVDALPADQAHVTRSWPSDPPTNPEAYDVIVIDGIPPESFPEAYPERLAEAVAGAGRGFFLINGSYTGSLEDETRIGLWEKTPLGSLLPVSTDMRAVVVEPPPRDIAIIVDVSGSMQGWQLQEAKQIGVHVISKLRPIDHVTLITFSAGHTILLDRIRMSSSGQVKVEQAMGSLVAGGGSFAGGALDAVSGLTDNSCALIFLSDGEIDGVSQKPGCETVVFEISGERHIKNLALRRLGQVIPVDSSGLQGGVKIKYLDPEVREERWRPGKFTPLAVTDSGALVPPIPVDGIAVSYVRPEAERISVHPNTPPDPVLALRTDTRGSVAVFLGNLDGTWARRPDGVEAMKVLIGHLAGWSALDRYALDFFEEVGGYLLDLTVLDERGFTIPERMEAMLVIQGGASFGVPLNVVAGEPDHFRGFVRFPPSVSEAVFHGILHLSEVGTSVLEQSQKIPVRLPSPSGVGTIVGASEAWSFGVNRALLNKLAILTGGQKNSWAYAIPMQYERPRPIGRPIHHWFIAFAACSFVAGLWLGGAKQ